MSLDFGRATVHHDPLTRSVGNSRRSHSGRGCRPRTGERYRSPRSWGWKIAACAPATARRAVRLETVTPRTCRSGSPTDAESRFSISSRVMNRGCRLQPRMSPPANPSSALFVQDLHKHYGDVRAVDESSTWTSAPANASGCSVRTAPGRRPRSRSVKACSPDWGGWRSSASAGTVTKTSSVNDSAFNFKKHSSLTSSPSPKSCASSAAFMSAGERWTTSSGCRAARRKARRTRRQILRRAEQRLALACAIVGDPDLLFLDEPTTGLDPQSRRQLWDLITDFKARGRTIMLAAHHRRGRILAERVARSSTMAK